MTTKKPLIIFRVKAREPHANRLQTHFVYTANGEQTRLAQRVALLESQGYRILGVKARCQFVKGFGRKFESDTYFERPRPVTNLLQTA